MKIIEFKGNVYPAFQADGFAARFAFPFALEICKGLGVDVGYSKPEWKLPGSIGVDKKRFCDTYGVEISDENDSESSFGADDFDQLCDNLTLDYVASFHCLEHLPNWVDSLNYWTTKIKSGGHLFLYIPDKSQKYWSPWSNRKHIHSFDPEIIREYLMASGAYKNIFVSGVDAYNSFTAFAEKI